jgi:uncharacterized protein (TIGR02453 family)
MQYGHELLQFLTELRENNNKEWFENNRNRYQVLRNSFTETMINLHGSLRSFDNGLENTDAKGSLFRINRDIRFSKDKSPYKNNFGSYFSEGGKKIELAGYYVHIQPQNNFVGGGLYMPHPADLKKIRQEIDYHQDEFLQIVNNTDFKKYFSEIQGEKLKNTPKEYEKDHVLGEYLKLKGYFVVAKLSDAEVCSSDFLNHITAIFHAMYPLNLFLNRSIRN